MTLTVRQWFRLQRQSMLTTPEGAAIERLVSKALGDAVTPIEGLGPGRRVIFDPTELVATEKLQLVQQLMDLAVEDIERELQRHAVRDLTK